MNKQEIIDKICELDISQNVKANCIILIKDLHFKECNEVLRSFMEKLKKTEKNPDVYDRKEAKILLVMSDIDYYVEKYNCDFDDFDDDDAILSY
jgi:hypothetical protein